MWVTPAATALPSLWGQPRRDLAGMPAKQKVPLCLSSFSSPGEASALSLLSLPAEGTPAPHLQEHRPSQPRPSLFVEDGRTPLLALPTPLALARNITSFLHLLLLVIPPLIILLLPQGLSSQRVLFVPLRKDLSSPLPTGWKVDPRAHGTPWNHHCQPSSSHTHYF